MKSSLIYLMCFFIFLPLSWAQVDNRKLDKLAVAISHAEGFGVRHVIPTRYHNPGDLKSRRGLTKLPGQKSLGKGDHIIFANDAAGWAALKDYLSKMVDGRSRRYRPSMTLTQVAKTYAGRWRPWAASVSKELGVSPTATIAELLSPDVDNPLMLGFQNFGPDRLDALIFATPAPSVILAEK
jgi:hypothetical protein